MLPRSFGNDTLEGNSAPQVLRQACHSTTPQDDFLPILVFDPAVPTYAIGDIQGCFQTFQALLTRIGYRPDRDELWLTGDLVNRGPDSLSMLRWCIDHEPIVVLGNHDLHLLGRAFAGRKSKRLDTLQTVLEAPDVDRLLYWLRKQPLLHQREEWLLVHAGLAPTWSTQEAHRHARSLESKLRGEDFATWLANPEPAEKNRLQTFTTMRMLNPDLSLDKSFKEAPEDAPAELRPWYELVSNRAETILFGHWAGLGYRNLGHAVALDSGCVWGGALTAYCLETGAVTQVESLESIP